MIHVFLSVCCLVVYWHSMVSSPHFRGYLEILILKMWGEAGEFTFNGEAEPFFWPQEFDFLLFEYFLRHQKWRLKLLRQNTWHVSKLSGWKFWRQLYIRKIFKIWKSLKTFIKSFNGLFIVMSKPKIFKNLLIVFDSLSKVFWKFCYFSVKINKIKILKDLLRSSIHMDLDHKPVYIYQYPT